MITLSRSLFITRLHCPHRSHFSEFSWSVHISYTFLVNLWNTLHSALYNSIYKIFPRLAYVFPNKSLTNIKTHNLNVFPSVPKPVTPPWKQMRLIWHDVFLTNPWWLSLISLSSLTCLQIVWLFVPGFLRKLKVSWCVCNSLTPFNPRLVY